MLARLYECREKSYYTTSAALAAAWALAKCYPLKFDVIGKALSGELCCTDICCLSQCRPDQLK